MKWVTAGVTFVNLSVVCGIFLGLAGRGLNTTSAALALVCGGAFAVAAFLGTGDSAVRQKSAEPKIEGASKPVMSVPPPVHPPAAASPAQPTVEDQPRPEMSGKPTLSGIGGWLTFFCVRLTILTPLWTFLSLGQIISSYHKAKPAFDRLPALKSGRYLQIGVGVILLVYGFVVGCIIWSGSRSGRRIARQFLIIALVGDIAIAAIAFAVSPPPLSSTVIPNRDYNI